MSYPIAFRLPRLCLPRQGIDLSRWAVVACDQYTSEPEYWAAVEQAVGAAPSTLAMIFPEVYLGRADAPQRIAGIQATMRRYLAEGLLIDHDGAVYVERTIHGRTRRGLMLEIDLEHYEFSATTTSLVRPTEGTIVERLAPRIEVRRDAELELPHIAVLIDDPQGTVIEPLAAQRERMPVLYDTALMQGGGHVSGRAVGADAARRVVQALQALAEPAAFAARYRVSVGTPPMLFPVGDGNHSLATAKAIWEGHKARVGMQHPSRWALVEVQNIHDSALEFEPIHRVLFGASADFAAALRQAFGNRLTLAEVPTHEAMRAAVREAAARGAREADPAAAPQVVGLVTPGPRYTVATLTQPPSPLAVGTLQAVMDDFLARGGASHIDYVHGDDVLERLGAQPGSVGIHLPTVGKSDLLRMVVLQGPLPRKTFSMGEAHEKRFYMEARRIR